MSVDKNIRSLIWEKYITNPLLDYCYQSIILAIILDLSSICDDSDFASIWDKFNVCLSVSRLAFVNSGDLKLVINHNCTAESSLWIRVMASWLSNFSKKHNLDPDFEYFYFFNLYGDAAIYLNLNNKQLKSFYSFFKNDHDSVKFTHLWRGVQFPLSLFTWQSSWTNFLTRTPRRSLFTVLER